jgi:hypothetical protein
LIPQIWHQKGLAIPLAYGTDFEEDPHLRPGDVSY